MTASLLRASGSSLSMLPRNASSRLSIARHDGWNSVFLIALLCISLAILLVPEKPQEMASICERHNPAIACQVW